MDLGQFDTGFSVSIYDPNVVDRTTVEADYPWAAGDDSQTAVFVTWWDSTHSRISAMGVVVDRVGGRYQPSEVIRGSAAVQFMTEAGMMHQNEEARRSLVSNEVNLFVELSVAGFRGFADKRTLRFAAPNAKPGSGLTVLVGANNSGKSTFIESLHALARARNNAELSFAQPRRHHSTDAVELDIFRSDGRRLRVASIRPGGSQARATWLPEGAGPDMFDIHVTPSRRSFNPYFGSMGFVDRNWGLTNQELSRTELRDQFVGRLRKVDSDPDARTAFDGLLREILGHDLNWTIDEIATGQQFLKLTEREGAWHTSEGLGDGLISLLFIVDALYDSEPGSLIAIDEPELSLHPQLVRRLGRVLARYAADRQIIVATHSPLLLHWSDVANGATVARVYKRDGRSEVAQVSPETLNRLSKLSDARNAANPHTVGTVAREALFLEDGVVLMEGQDDVAYLPRILNDLGLPAIDNVYGWGSGGVGNMPTLARLFIELGFDRVAAVVDDDGQPSTDAVVEALEAMGEAVLVVKIPAPDIRYKPAAPSRNEVLGLLDEGNRRVRPEHREPAKRALERVIEHISRT